MHTYTHTYTQTHTHTHTERNIKQMECNIPKALSDGDDGNTTCVGDNGEGALWTELHVLLAQRYRYGSM